MLLTILSNKSEQDAVAGECHKPNNIALLIFSRIGYGTSTKNPRICEIQFNILNLKLEQFTGHTLVLVRLHFTICFPSVLNMRVN